MLLEIDKGVSKGEVITIKMTTGEELLATLEEETPTGYKITRPMVLSAGPKGIGMMPYIFTVHPDKKIELLKHAVTTVVATEQDFANQYIQSTTGIALS
jgi:hypothetical protein